MAAVNGLDGLWESKDVSSQEALKDLMIRWSEYDANR